MCSPSRNEYATSTTGVTVYHLYKRREESIALGSIRSRSTKAVHVHEIKNAQMISIQTPFDGSPNTTRGCAVLGRTKVRRAYRLKSARSGRGRRSPTEPMSRAARLPTSTVHSQRGHSGIREAGIRPEDLDLVELPTASPPPNWPTTTSASASGARRVHRLRAPWRRRNR